MAIPGADLFDAYVIRARIVPVLLVTLPAALTVLAWAPGNALGWNGLASVFIAAGGAALFAQLGRDLGKKRQAALFESRNAAQSRRATESAYARSPTRRHPPGLPHNPSPDRR